MWLAGINYESLEQTSFIEEFIEKNKVMVLAHLPSAFAEIAASSPKYKFLKVLQVLESQRIHLNHRSHSKMQESLGYEIPDLDRIFFANSNSELLEMPSKWGFLITLRQVRIQQMLNQNVSPLSICKELGVSRRTVNNLIKKINQ